MQAVVCVEVGLVGCRTNAPGLNPEHLPVLEPHLLSQVMSIPHLSGYEPQTRTQVPLDIEVHDRDSIRIQVI